MFTNTVIILSFRVHVGPISTQTARGEGANPKNTPRLTQKARSTVKFSLKQDFLALKVKEHHSSLFLRQVSEPIGTSFWREFERLCCLWTLASLVGQTYLSADALWSGQSHLAVNWRKSNGYMPYSPCFRRMACCNSCAWKPRTKGHSWHRSIYMWKRYLLYRGQEILGQSGKKRTRKWSTFKDCHRMDRCSLKRS